ncbi:hypothetical protein NCCP2222_37490 [Sporosarcina sp. NCCP-2222]|uniref:ABC transporter permease n=1 Tax=Sporosarcina sp. NCCP-2222 TaxID=2935073 RepID=UPI0020868831|nr:ABC transporter permease [Sporosarcina sp. NCCP-2222]GKV57802.1 hypothetical protein NCCP2222_37490 [Sporosarcina sp. NCCP-2222]
MISLSWRRIRNQKSKSAMTIISITAIILLTSFGIQISNETKLIVSHNLENYSRGSYDILVRPEGARTNIEKKLKTVEENYIGDGSGGISILEWERIKEHPEIEIAAPVASLGYFTSNTASIRLPAFDSPVKFEYEFFTSDGINKYPVTPSHGVYYLQFINNQNLYAIDTYPDISKDHNPFDSGLDISFPQSYNLLTAIDAESESLLTGIDFSELFRELTEEEKKTIETFSQFRGNAPVVPILQRNNFQVPLSLQVTVKKLDLSLDDLYKRYGIPSNESIIYEVQFFDDQKRKEFENDLTELQTLNQNTYNIDLTNYQSPFDAQHLSLDQDFNLKRIGQNEGGTLYNDSGKYFTASKIDYSFKDNKMYVNLVEDGPPPAYKEVKEAGNSYLNNWEAPFMIWQMGKFTAEAIDSSLTSSPLGIYSTNKVKTLDDTNITPTITPGSFIAAPTAGMTTLEAASLIKGDHPIDAIRIKLNNITAYDEEAQKRIEALATELSNEGYVVDIVAGSSFKNVNMFVEGIGEVTSPWTTLGVSQLLSNAWNLDTTLSIRLFILFGVFWFFSHLSFERNRLDAENEILTFLGWQKRSIRVKNMTEQLILVFISSLFSAVLALILRLSSLAFIVIGCFMLISIFLIAIVFYVNPRQSTRSTRYRFFASIQHYKSLLIPTMLVLLLAVCISQLQISSIYELWTKSSETTLGIFILHEGLSIRFLIVIATILLSVSVLVEAIGGILFARREEFKMYHVIGWTEKMIRIQFLKEVAIWATLSLVSGIIVSTIISIMLDTSLVGVAIGIATSSIIYLLIVFTTVTFRKYR